MTVAPVTFFVSLALGILPSGDWLTIPACQSKDVQVRVKVLRRASLATADWLIIEFENRSGQALPVAHGNYRIEKEVDDLRTGKGVHTGSLASGNSLDLLGSARETLPAGIHRNLRQVSDYSAALMGLPPQDGWHVRARLHLDLQLSDGRDIATPAAGVPFSFEWRRPDETGYAAIRKRLTELLQKPEDQPHHTYILDAYLKVPEVARAFTCDDLLKALAGRKGSFDGRWSLLRHLAAQHAADPKVVAFFLPRLREGSVQALDDLSLCSLWDRSFAAPLLRSYRTNPQRYQRVPGILEYHWSASFAVPLAELVAADADAYGDDLYPLSRHRGDWASDTKLAGRVGNAVRKSCPLVEREVQKLTGKELQDWTAQAKRWALTGDRSALPMFRPALRDRRQVPGQEGLSIHGYGGTGGLDPAGDWPPLRVCDFALEAVLTVLDGPEKGRALSFVDGTPPQSPADAKACASAARDRMITDVERRLADGAGMRK